MITRRPVNPDQEYVLLGALIMNKESLSAAHERYKKGELKSRFFSRYFQVVFRWLIQYYTKHQNCPGSTIQKIYNTRKSSLSEDSRELVEDYLQRLADEYQESESESSYISNEVLPNFIRERELADRLDKVQQLISKGNLVDAEDLIKSYQGVSDSDEDETIIPYTLEDIKESMKIENAEKIAYRFSGDLDDMIGPLCKSWLVAITGIEKAGKSYILNEIAHDAVLHQNKKVLYVNIELVKTLVRDRCQRRISRTATKHSVGEKGKRLVIPIFDCENNQYGTCRVLKKPLNKKPLFKTNDEIIEFEQRKDWQICDRCRGAKIRRNQIRTKKFIPAIWFEIPKLIRLKTEKRLCKVLKNNKYLHYKNFRVRCFPRFSVTFGDVENYIKKYIEKSNWKPDIIIIDYLDILLPDAGLKETRNQIDTIWKNASRLAAELDCLLLTADQATKASRTQYQLDQMSTSESKTKDSHLDVRIAINQMDEEKQLGIARLGVLFHRHENFNVRNEVLITQRLATAQPILDNHSIYGGKKTYRVHCNG